MTEQEDFASLFTKFERTQARKTRQEPKVGDKVRGTIVSIQGDRAFVDIGLKTEGVIDVGELRDENGHLSLDIGDSIEMLVSGKEAETGTLLLGAQHARRLRGRDGLQQAHEQQLPVEGLVTGTTKGGLEVEISGERGFCPASQIDVAFIEDLSTFVGQRLAFRITKLEGGRSLNLVLSRRALLEEAQRLAAATTRARLEVGAVMKGRVTAIKDFGAFIDLGGVEGMVHISELAFGRVAHPKDLLTLGQMVEAVVLRIDKTDNPKQPERIALSIRALEKDPWEEVVDRFPVGALVSGTVSRLQSFGVFVELAPGIDGLVHISELGAGRRIQHPQEVVKVGEAVQATVLGVDKEKRRISLSLDSKKQHLDLPKPEDVADYTKPKPGFSTLGDLLKERWPKK